MSPRLVVAISGLYLVAWSTAIGALLLFGSAEPMLWLIGGSVIGLIVDGAVAGWSAARRL